MMKTLKNADVLGNCRAIADKGGQQKEYFQQDESTKMG
jgi:hypothetical protein